MSVNLYTPDANVIVHETKVDFRRRVVQRQINLVQYDKSMPVIAVKLCSNGNDYVLPETASAYIRFGKRDHTYVYNECLGCDQTRTIVYFAITDQMTIFYGEHTPIVELRIGDTVAGSGSIPIWIDRNPIQNGDTESKSDLSVFEKAIEAAQKIDAKLPTDLGASATNLHLLTGATKLGGGINLSGFEYDEATKTLKAKGGVSPCLNLIDMEEGSVRTSITEEEKTNLENGLYNSVLYMDGSSPTDEFSLYFPEFLSGLGYEIFTTFNVSVDETAGTYSIVGMSGYQMQLGEKGSDGNYPITITKTLTAPFGGGGGTVEVITATKTSDPEFEALGFTAIKLDKVPTSSQFILSYDNESLLMYKDSDGLYRGASFVNLYSAGLSCAFVNVDSSGNAIGAFRKYDLSFLNDMKRENVGKVLTIESTGHAFFKMPESSSSVTIRRW